MLKHIQLTNTGPIENLNIEFADRLNLLTGDNGLGKTFLLDIAWWILTHKWPADINSRLTAGRMAVPNDRKCAARIAYSYSGSTKNIDDSSEFDRQRQDWPIRRGRPSKPGLVFYAMADGSFAVWDPARNYRSVDEPQTRHWAYVFSPKEVWDGLERTDGTILCNGLIRDWASWQKENGESFALLKKALITLSPDPAELLEPGELTRISLDDVRDIPTLKTAYGQSVPVLHASSGMRRIIALAYFMVWCWEEHRKAADLLGEKPATQVTFLVDEAESHLHPKWQRRIIPSLMRVMDDLIEKPEVQLIVVTHSPLIMASAETLFDSTRDAWFDFDLADYRATLTRRDYVRHGEIGNWLTSEAFDLKTQYNLEAETVMTEAVKSMRDPAFSKEQAIELDAKLRSVLSETDPFWMRWQFLAEKKGWFE